jgi:hypothetical protein
MTCFSGPGLQGDSALKACDNPIFEYKGFPSPTVASLSDTTSADHMHQASRSSSPSQPLEFSPCSMRSSRWKVLEKNLPKMTPPHKHIASDAHNHLRALRTDMDEMLHHFPRSQLGYAASDRSLVNCSRLPANPSSPFTKYSPVKSGVCSLVDISSLATTDHRSLHSLQEQVHAIMRWQCDMAREIRMIRVR